MFQSYLAAALRNLLRNGLYAVINILGLALGFSAVILIALFVREEYSYDSFFPDPERVYNVTETVRLPGEGPLRIGVVASNIAGAMKLDFPEVEAVTRLAPAQASLRHGGVDSSAFIHWADPNFFELFPLKVLAGNPGEALKKPDALVLTRKAARRYFGRDDVVGEALELNRQYTMHVGAVIEDLPSNTHFAVDVFAPGIASFSQLTFFDSARPDPDALRPENFYTYVRLRPGAAVSGLTGAMPGFISRHVSGAFGGQPVSKYYQFNLTPLTQIYLQPGSIADMKPHGDVRTLQTLIAIAVLILFVASSNFVSMMTARAAGRALEVGVRKAEGATRRQIVVQFLGECLCYAALALVFAMIVVELILPMLNGFLQRDIAFDYVREPLLGGALFTIWLVVGLSAGAYAAFVLSMFRPAGVLKGVVFLAGGSGRLRQALVIFQFGTLIALIVSTMTIQRQTQYAMQDRLRLPTDQIFVVSTGCPTSFKDAVARVQGVLAASCSSGSALTYDRFSVVFESRDGRSISMRGAPVDYGFFELFAVKPTAGRLFAPDRGEDDVLRGTADAESNPSFVINETAARTLGYASPQSAVNEYKRWGRISFVGDHLDVTKGKSSQLIGVIPDFSVGSVRDVIEPTVYYVDPQGVSFTVLKLDGRTIPETMRTVKTAWEKTQNTPFDGLFLSQRVNEIYADIQRQSTLFSVFSGVAVVIAALGLLGLAVFTAERRTREIGLRKVMGASRWDILRFLGWQFARPVLWANLIAWPLAYLCMHRWLEGFAYHVDLNPLAFVVASVLALVIALATVSGHALMVARTRPVEALRYE
ncbi:MAG TPA: FtsX-like permease family protein [Steroidobacteraceae bacterium]|nr:FtsX-like permease family protein [Steroidobacteraceae bacterium]